MLDSNILDAGVFIDEILERKDDDRRRQFMREFAIDLYEKSKQASTHSQKIKRKTFFYKLTSPLRTSLTPTRNGDITNILDSYEAVVSKIKGISDNMASLVLACYLPKTKIESYWKYFLKNPKRARQLRPDDFEDDFLDGILPTVKDPDSGEQVQLHYFLSGIYEQNRKIFQYHRNMMQHSKTDQSLSITKSEVLVPAAFVPNHINKEQRDKIPLQTFLPRALDQYLRASRLITYAIATDKSLDILKPEREDATQIRAKHVRDKVWLTFGPKLLTGIGICTLAYMPLKKFTDVNQDNEILTQVYEVNKINKGVLLSPYATNDERVKRFFNKQREFQVMDKQDADYTAQLLSYMGKKQKNEYLQLLDSISDMYRFGHDDMLAQLDLPDTFQDSFPSTSTVHKEIPQAYDVASNHFFSLDELLIKKMSMEHQLFEQMANAKEPVVLSDHISKCVLQAYTFSSRFENAKHAMAQGYAGQYPRRKDLETKGRLAGYESRIYNALKGDDDVELLFSEDFFSGLQALALKINPTDEGERFLHYLYNHTSFLSALSLQTDLNYHENDFLTFVKESDYFNGIPNSNMGYSLNPLEIELFRTSKARCVGSHPLHMVKLPVPSWDGKATTLVKDSPTQKTVSRYVHREWAFQ